MSTERPWWDGSDELRRYREAEGARDPSLYRRRGPRFLDQVQIGFGRSIGWSLGRRLLNAIFGRG